MLSRKIFGGNLARINIEDTLESHDEFWELMKLVGDRDRALGQCVRFFRLAQDCYAKGFPLSKQLLADKGIEHFIDAGFAVQCSIFPDSFQVKNPEKFFAWIMQRVEGGKSKSNAKIDALNKNRLKRWEKQNGIRTGTERNRTDTEPLTPSPSLSLSQLRNKKGEEASPPNGAREFIAAYCDAIKKRYGKSPLITGKLAGQFKNFLKEVPLQTAIQLVQAYVQMDNKWFTEKCHDFQTFLNNLNKISIGLQIGNEPGSQKIDWKSLGEKIGAIPKSNLPEVSDELE